LTVRSEALTARNEALQAERDALRAGSEQFVASTSWRLTKPVRRIGTRLR
jgi:hypothetical protein